MLKFRQGYAKLSRPWYVDIIVLVNVRLRELTARSVLHQAGILASYPLKTLLQETSSIKAVDLGDMTKASSMTKMQWSSMCNQLQFFSKQQLQMIGKCPGDFAAIASASVGKCKGGKHTCDFAQELVSIFLCHV